jgi:hypothetical protein
LKNQFGGAMINDISNFISAQHPLVVVGSAVVIGILARPLIAKIVRIALDIFSSITSWIGNRTIVLRLRSLFCADCASNHKNHLNPRPVIQIPPTSGSPQPGEKVTDEG